MTRTPRRIFMLAALVWMAGQLETRAQELGNAPGVYPPGSKQSPVRYPGAGGSMPGVYPTQEPSGQIPTQPGGYPIPGQGPTGQIPGQPGIPGIPAPAIPAPETIIPAPGEAIPGAQPPTPESAIPGVPPGPEPGAFPGAPEAPGTLAPEAITPGVPEATEIPEFAMNPADSAAPAAGLLTAAERLTGFGSTFAFGTPEVMGDSFGLGILQRFPPIPNPPPTPPNPPFPPSPPNVPPRPDNPVRTAAIVPSIRGIKLSENQSPLPRDRLIYGFNYFNNVNYDLNQRFLSPVRNLEIYRHILGIEKTLFDKQASIGIRFPIDTITGDSNLPGIGGTSTAIDSVNVFYKQILLQNEAQTKFLTGGMAVGIPTGPGPFAGANYLADLNTTNLQPFLGSVLMYDRLFFQGFFIIDIPMEKQAPTMMYNDWAVGYFLYRSEDPDAFLRNIVPLFEVHVNTPLNHRGVSLDNPWSVPDFVNLTYGTSFQFGDRTRLLTGIVTPVTGPRVFDFEVMALLNIAF